MSGFKYSIITEIKKSDKSNVYLAAVEGHEYPVIIKEIRHGNIHVFEALKGIDSEYLPKIYYVEETEDGLLVVEEYVDGELLADHLVLHKMTEEECLDIAEQICDALDVLHSHKPSIIHRDIKPSNFIITSNAKLKLIDFDSSRLYKDDCNEDTRLLGTENYASPEQYGFSQTDCRSDIYSLGVVLRKFKEFLKPVTIKRWEKIVEKCTMFSPDSRYQNVQTVKVKLEKIVKLIESQHKKQLLFVLIFICLIVSGMGVLIYQNKTSKGTALAVGESTTEVTVETTSTTESPTTEVMTTEAPTIEATSTTEIPTTEVITTEPPTTDVPTTEIPTMEVSTTETPTTESIDMDELEIVSNKELNDYKTYVESCIYEIPDMNVSSIAALKEHIIETNARVLFCYKRRMQEWDVDFFFQVLDLWSDSVTFAGLRITSEIDDNTWNVPNCEYEVKEDVIIISKDYINSLEDGIYKLSAVLSNGNGQGHEVSTYVYITEDITEEILLFDIDGCTQEWIYEYKRGSNKNVNIVINNDVGIAPSHIVSIITSDNVERHDYIGADYRINWKEYRTRVLGISAEFINQYEKFEHVNIIFSYGGFNPPPGWGPGYPGIRIKFVD